MGAVSGVEASTRQGSDSAAPEKSSWSVRRLWAGDEAARIAENEVGRGPWAGDEERVWDSGETKSR